MLKSNEFHTKTILLSEEEIMDHLLEGAKIVARAVGATMGPAGNYVVFGDNPLRLWPWYTKDGVTVAREIEIDHPYQKIGADTVREAANTQVNQSGDGTTLTTILAYEILKEGIKRIKLGESRESVISNLKSIVNVVSEWLKQNAIECDKKIIIDVATIACNGDAALGKLIGEAVYKVGKYGIVTYDKSRKGESYVEYSDGLQWKDGISYRAFFNAGQNCLKLENPHIVVIEQPIRWGSEIAAILDIVVKAGDGRSICIVCPDISDEALGSLLNTCEKFNAGQAAYCFAPWVRPEGHIGTPALKSCLEDIAGFTGAWFISEESGLRIQQITLDMFGSADFIVSNEAGTILKRDSKSESQAERIDYLKDRLDKDLNIGDRKNAELSLARLSGGIATIKIYGSTDSERKELMERVEDAICASKSALEEGVVDGGGIALLEISKTLDNDSLAKILQAPVKTILNNSDSQVEFEGDFVICNLKQGFQKSYEVGTSNMNKSMSMLDNGIADPAKVIRTAVENAVSAACLMLKTTVIISNKKKET